MDNNFILPYRTLYKDDWTVSSLAVSLILNENKRIPLTELVDINPEKINNKNFDADEIPYIEIKDIDPEQKILKNYERVKFNELPSRGKIIAKNGNLLVSTIRPERGAIAIIPNEQNWYVVSNAIAILEPKKVSPYVLYFLLSSETILNEFGALARGVTIPTLAISQLKDYKLPIRIIDEKLNDKAERLYNRWFNAVNNSISLSEVIDRVLSKELLLNNESQQSNDLDEVTKILPYNFLKDRLDVDYYFSLFKPKPKWKCKVEFLKNLVGFKGVTDKPIRNKYFNNHIPYIKVQNLKPEALNINKEEIELRECEATNTQYYDSIFLKLNDILIPKMGGDIGRTMLVPEELTGAIVNPHIYVLTTQNDYIIPEYLAIFLKSKWSKEQAEMNVGGSSIINALKQKTLNEMEIPVPSLEKQMDIVNKVNEAQNKDIIEKLKKEIKTFIDEIYNEYGIDI